MASTATFKKTTIRRPRLWQNKAVLNRRFGNDSGVRGTGEASCPDKLGRRDAKAKPAEAPQTEKIVKNRALHKKTTK